jgi:hypothetical protein
MGIGGESVSKLSEKVDSFIRNVNKGHILNLSLVDKARVDERNHPLSNYNLLESINRDDIGFRDEDKIDKPTRGDIIDTLDKRWPNVVEVGKKIPLRNSDFIFGNRRLTMVDKFFRSDIPLVIAFFNNRRRTIPQEAFTDIDYSYNRTEKIKLPSGAELTFLVETPSDGAMLFVGLLYNGEEIIPF